LHYDFRHQCLTSLLEISEVSEETVQAMPDNKIGSKTPEHYSPIRIHKKQEAVDALASRRRMELRRAPQRERFAAIAEAHRER
jgi:hypothetical protein